MPVRSIAAAVALVSLTALAACQQQPMNDAQRAFIINGGFSQQHYQPQPVQFHPMVIPTTQPRGFSCNRVGSTTYCN